MSNINLPECVACKVVIGNKKGYVITLYRSPSQNQSEFEHFLSELEHFLLSLENLLFNIRSKDPAFTILVGDFNARSKSWLVHDFTNNKSTQIESMSSMYCFSQIRTNTDPPKFIILH